MRDQPEVFVARVRNPGLLFALAALAAADTANRAFYRSGRHFGPVGRLRPKNPEQPTWRWLWSQPAAGLAVILMVTTVRVMAGADGLQVGFGPWGWPARHVPLERIRSARVEPIRALPMLGYGYRGWPRHGRIVVRSGPGLVLELDDGSTFGVTIGPGAEQALTAINSALASSSRHAADLTAR